MSSPPTTTQTLLLPKLLEEVKDRLLDELHKRLAAEGYPDIRTAHGCVFRFLTEEGMRLSEMAALAGMTKQAVGEQIDDLVRLGYIERTPDPLDGRAKIVKPTAKGRAAMGVAHASFAAIEATWGEAVGTQRMAEMRETLETILALYE
jgi:DNA-binding MarR family transcriptional regulator